VRRHAAVRGGEEDEAAARGMREAVSSPARCRAQRGRQWQPLRVSASWERVAGVTSRWAQKCFERFARTTADLSLLAPAEEQP
jgi:hypothetical protein